jgi:large subunit ribosomal protein L32e
MVKKFIKRDINKKKRLQANWRRPKGITNKKRLNRKGHSPNVRPGYGTKAADRGKNKAGLMIVSVATLAELKKINPKTQAALLSGVGKKRKLELVAEAEKLKLTLVNFNAEAYKKEAEKFLSEKKQGSAKKKETKSEEKEAEKENKVEKEEKTHEEKKKEEKIEKDKVLTKGHKEN